MRTCAATGTKLHLIEPLGFKLDEKSIKRCGVNYIENCEYVVYKNWEEFKSKNDGEFYYLTRYGKHLPDEFSYKEVVGDIYLVFGKESTGIAKNILKQNLQHCIRLPMRENARSLNLSNTVAIMVYEVLRQLGYPNLSKVEVIKGEDFLTDNQFEQDY